jgi:hypothetical protein
MSQTMLSIAPLSPHWSVVVQLRESTALTPQSVQGRVEHITSGRATNFCSLAALQTFIKTVPTLPPKR